MFLGDLKTTILKKKKLLRLVLSVFNLIIPLPIVLADNPTDARLLIDHANINDSSESFKSNLFIVAATLIILIPLIYFPYILYKYRGDKRYKRYAGLMTFNKLTGFSLLAISICLLLDGLWTIPNLFGELSLLDFYLFGSCVGILAGFGCLTIGHNMTKRLYADREITYTKTQCEALLKGKLHDFRIQYNTIRNLVIREEFSRLKQYVDESANYYSYSLNNWSNKNWTIANELEVMYAYYAMQNVLGIEVRIEVKTMGVDIEKTKFIPEALTIFLQNSIIHGFQDRQAENMFKIDILKDGELIFFTISDNGTPSDLNRYIMANKPTKGLYILRERLRNEARLHYLKTQLF